MLVKSIIYFCFIFLLSCTTSQIKKAEPEPASPKAMDIYKSALQEIKDKKYSSALVKLQNIVINHPNMVLANESLYLIGQIHERTNQKKEAYQAYMSIVQSPYYSSKEFLARLKVSDFLIEAENYDEAINYIDSIIKTDRVKKEWLEKAHLMRIEIYLLKQRNILALESLLQLSVLSEQASSRDAYRMRALDLVNSNLTKDELMQIVGNRKFDLIRPLAFYQLGKMFFEQQEFSRAASYLKSSISIDGNSRYAELSKHILEQINARSKNEPYTIGAVLPLSGRLAPIGKRSLQGMQLGLGIFGQKRSSFSLSVMDSESDPNIARAAVEKLVVEDHISALIGSLLSRPAFEVAEKANELGVPSLALSQRNGLQEIGNNVFQHALTSRMQVKTLVDTAINKLNIRRFAILYPDDPYGKEFADLFWQEVIKRGGEINAAQKYQSGETDFKNVIQRLVGTYYTEARKDEYNLRLKEWQENKRNRDKQPSDLLLPIIEFDAIFIPDSAKALGQIAPMLDYNNVRDIRLLGTNLWNTSSFINRMGKYAKQAIFVDSHTESEQNPAQKAFAREYHQTFGEEPDSIAIQGYEAASILRYIIEEKGERSRGAIRSALENLENFSSLSGNLSMNEQREIEKPVSVLTIENGRVIDFQK